MIVGNDNEIEYAFAVSELYSMQLQAFILKEKEKKIVGMLLILTKYFHLFSSFSDGDGITPHQSRIHTKGAIYY